MSDRYATVKVTEFDGKLYPVGSDTPIPEDCVIVTEPANHKLMYGDVVIDTYGQVWVVDESYQFVRDGQMTGLEAWCPLDESVPSKALTEIEAPYVIVCRQSQPTEILVEV